MAFAWARASPGGMSKPVTSSTTISGMAPLPAPITGRPAAIASMRVRPKGSGALGTKLRRSDACNRRGISSR